MTEREPDGDLNVLGPLGPRAVALRHRVRSRYGKEDPAQLLAVAELISLAVAAAHAGDLAAAGSCLAEGELVAAPWAAHAEANAAASLTAGRAAAAALKLKGQIQVLAARPAARPGDGTVSVINAGVSGRVPLPSPDPSLVIASDGSYSRGYYGWAYITSSGRWRARAGSLGADPSGALLAELAAAGMAAAGIPAAEVPGSGVLLTDSLAAAGYLAGWQRGSAACPALAGTEEQSRKRARVVADARAALARRQDLDVMHVHGHAGHPLNEAADILAKMARRWRAGEETPAEPEMRRRCGEVAAAFLRSWYGQPPPGMPSR